MNRFVSREHPVQMRNDRHGWLFPGVLVVIVTFLGLVLMTSATNVQPIEFGTFNSSLTPEPPSVRSLESGPRPVDYIGLDSLLTTMMPSADHLRLVWDAREILIGQCLALVGLDWRARPHGDSVEEWRMWHQWFDPLAAENPNLEVALFGVGGGGGTSSEGCQIDAYLALHKGGVPAEARAADLYNDAASVALGVASEEVSDLGLAVHHALSEWSAMNADELLGLRDDVSAEATLARRILENA